MTSQQLQGQGVSNVLQTVIAVGIIWMAATINDVSGLVKMHDYRISMIEQTIQKPIIESSQ